MKTLSKILGWALAIYAIASVAFGLLVTIVPLFPIYLLLAACTSRNPLPRYSRGQRWSIGL